MFLCPLVFFSARARQLYAVLVQHPVLLIPILLLLPLSHLLAPIPLPRLKRYQLIYAWGAPTELPAQQARARACQALLHILSAGGRQGALGEVLAREGVAKPAKPEGAPPGSFRGFRLLPGAALEAAAPALRRQLAEALLARPPYALRWMRDYPKQVCPVFLG